MKQTAVEWLQYELASRGSNSTTQHSELFEQAKEMEKQQIIDAYENGYSDSDNTFELNKQYYKETFNKEELPKIKIDWSGFPKSTQEQVGFIELNIIDKWLEENSSPEIAKQVEEEAKELCEQNIQEKILISNNFLKKKGQFGEYFYHEKYQLFRCWFYNGELQIGKKDIEKDICIWIATIDNKIDFENLFRILTKDTICNFSNSKKDLESNGYFFEAGV